MNVVRIVVTLLCWSLGLVGASAVVSTAAASDAALEIPPEPERPDRDSMSEEEYDRVWAQWRVEHQQWEASLTVEQAIELKRRDAEELARSQEPYQRRQRLPRASDDYDWYEHAREKDLGAGVIAGLERDGLAFGQSRKQSFEPYLNGPVFVTSDSLLNAFHVLFEDSFRQLEARHVTSLRNNLDWLLRRKREAVEELQIDSARLAEASNHVERVLGPALVLLGHSLDDFPAKLQPDIAAQVELIRDASARLLPAWLAPADPASLVALDYPSCKPVGFYAESERLADYFRAVRWLQMIPLRAAREREFDAAALLALADSSSVADSLVEIAELVGPGDDPTITDLSNALGGSYPIDFDEYDHRRREVRLRAMQFFTMASYYRVNSDLRRDATLLDAFSELTFRVMPAAVLPDAIALQKLMDRELAPSGLAVAAWLGSSFATERLGEEARELTDWQRAEWEQLRRKFRWGDGRMLYDKYLETLEALFLPAPGEAPRFAHSEAWAAKNCQTALAGWAQMRHTFTLQAKMSKMYLGVALLPPGFVEPNPEFFARMARLIDEMEASFGSLEPSEWQEAEKLRKWAQAVREPPDEWPEREAGDAIMLSEEESLNYARTHAIRYMPNPDALLLTPITVDAPDIQERRQQVAAALEKKADAIEHGEIPLPAGSSELQDRWTVLSRTAHTLEALAHKQLRGESWTPEEGEFLKGYGEAMAGVMGYEGNSWLTPLDDAPRCAEVASFPPGKTSLLAAVGRPREIHVLYPWQGIDILCTGSVMQYYEFEAGGPLTDNEWRDKLDSDAAPSIPEWLVDYAEPPGIPPAGH